MDEASRSQAYVTLRISSDSLSPDEITKVLRTQPSREAVKGEPSLAGKRKPAVANTWQLDGSVGVDTDIEGHIRELTDFVASRADELNRLVRTSDASVDILCTFGSPSGWSALVLDAELLTKLALVPMQLGLTWTTES